jgi:AraC-like DNA-binding protein
MSHSGKEVQTSIYDLVDYSEAVEISKDILFCMENKRIFLNPELKLSDLAQEINKPNYIVTCVLNKHMKTNFYTLVNKWRIQEFKKAVRSANSASYTILALAYAAGFNSKATFNKVFKEKEGITPSHYRKTILTRIQKQ